MRVVVIPYVFPAYAGMSPRGACILHSPGGVPRLRGDEPEDEMVKKTAVRCSPPTRG